MNLRALAGTISILLAPFVLTTCQSGDPTAPIPLVWSTVSSGTTQDLRGIWGSSPSDVWAVGYATILHYNGTSWSSVPSPVSGRSQLLFGVWGSSASDVWAVGADYEGQMSDEPGSPFPPVILHYDGTSWSSVSTDATLQFYSIWGANASDVWAGGAEEIMHFDGSAWAITSTGVASPTYGIAGTSSSNVWFVGSSLLHDGWISHWGGAGWLGRPATTTYPVTDVWANSASDVWALTSGQILHYDGTSWSSVSSGLATNLALTDMWGTSSSNMWAVTSGYPGELGGTIRHYDGTTWVTVSSGTAPNFFRIWGTSPSNLWVVGEAGTLVHGAPAQ